MLIGCRMEYHLGLKFIEDLGKNIFVSDIAQYRFKQDGRFQGHDLPIHFKQIIFAEIQHDHNSRIIFQALANQFGANTAPGTGDEYPLSMNKFINGVFIQGHFLPAQ